MSAVIKQSEDGIRRMLEEDLDQVMQIEESIYRFPWTRGIFHDCLQVGYYCVVMQTKGEIVAYAILSLAAKEAHILTICVRPEQQGKGIGRAMMEHMLDVVKRYEATTVYLEVRPSNHTAIWLYQNMGFNEIGVRPDYYPAEDGREDALIMAMDLNG